MHTTLKRYAVVFVILLSSLSTSFAQQKKMPDVKLKFGKGLKITAADSSMQLKTSFRFQTLFNYDQSLAEGAEGTSGLVIRRSRLKFDGWAFSPKLKFKVELALSPRDIKASSGATDDLEGGAAKIVLDAIVAWNFQKNWTLVAGQTKLPSNRERLISSQKLQLVDRSLLNSYFTLDRDIGLQLKGKYKLGKTAVIKPIFALSMGEGRNIVAENTGGYQYTGKIEFLPMGEFTSKGDYFGGDLKREPSPKLAITAAYDFNDGASRQRGNIKNVILDDKGNTVRTDLSSIYADMIFKYQGYSAMVEYANRTASTSGEGFHTGSALNVTMGYLFKKNYEIALRYTNITPDSDKAFTKTDEYTFGLSKYIVDHNLKVQTDFSLIEEEGAEDPSIRYRLQFEFAF